MTMASGFFLRASMFLLASSPAIAGTCASPSIVLNTFDRDFKIQRDLRAEDITVEVGRKRVPFVSLSLDDHSRKIVLMVDTSASMGASQNRGLGLTIPAAVFAAGLVPPSASSALVTFSEKMRRESKDFEDPKELGARVLDLTKTQPRGLTALADSVDRVLVEFPELRFGDAIYLVTDGGNDSGISLHQLEKKVLSRGVRVFVFLVSFGGPRTQEETLGAEQISSFAEFTGGRVVPISAAELTGSERTKLDELAPRIVSQVEGVYRVDLSIPQEEQAGRVKVSLANRDRAKNTGRVIYSHQVMPCPQAP
jgi:hypothetical protein